MISTLVSQVQRILNDNGQNDRDFSQDREKVRAAEQALRDAAAGLMRAADNLADLITTNAPAAPAKPPKGH